MIITKQGNGDSTIAIEETFRAKRENVFRAWTKAESLKKWFLADESAKVKNAEVNLHVGGSYFIEVLFPGFDPTLIDGEFSKVISPEALEYTWNTPVLNGRVTNVEVRFEDFDEGSRIFLTHGEFLTAEEMQLHLDGWRACIGKLHKLLGT